MKKTTFLSVLLTATLTFNMMNFVSAQNPTCLPLPPTDLLCNYRTSPPLGWISPCELLYVPMPPVLCIWQGTINNDWFNPGNWFIGIPPSPANDVWIPSGLVNYPTILPGSQAFCHNIWIRDGASILGNQWLTIGGLAYVERAVNNENWIYFNHCNWIDDSNPITPPCDIHYLSSPVTNANDSTVEQDAVFKWVEPTQTWNWLHHSCSEPCWKPPQIWIPGKGYSVAPNHHWWCNTTDCQIYNSPPGLCAAPWKCQFYREWIGTNLNWGEINYNDNPPTVPPLSYTVQPPIIPPNLVPPGWHLLGNPYPSAIDWNVMMAIPTIFNIFGNSACMWDDQLQAYIYVTGITGPLNGIIPIIQGFMVQAMPPGGSVMFVEAARLHNNNIPLYKSVRNNFLTIKVNDDGSSFKDETYIHINPEAEIGMDRLDGSKLGNGAGVPMIYSVLPDNTSLAYNSLNSTETSPAVPVHFIPGVNGTYTLQVSGIESFSENTPIFMEDRMLNVSQDLRENPVYTFNANTTDNPARFVLYFTPLGVNDYHYGDINIYSYNQTVFVDLPVKINGTANVFNMLGKEIISQPMIPGKLNKIDVSGPTGHYVVRIVSSGSVTTQKVFIN